MDPLQAVLQFLKEEGYTETFETLQKESGKDYIEGAIREHVIRLTLGELQLTNQTATMRALLSGPKLELRGSEDKSSLDASPVALIALKNFSGIEGFEPGDYILASFNNQTIRLFNRKLEQLISKKLSLPTILCFQQKDGKIYFSTMGGHIGVLNTATLDVDKTVVVGTQHMTNLRISENYLIATSYSGALVYIKIDDFTTEKVYDHPHPISGMCLVNDGVVYALQNDNCFQFRPTANHSEVKYLLKNPTEFDVVGFGIRDMKESPTDPSTFIALTDQNRAVIYKFTPSAKDLEVLANISHITSDGLTQPQIIWPLGAVAISTTDDFKVVAIDIESNKVIFELSNWNKATRCLAVIDDDLFVGAFDKTLSRIGLSYVE